MAPVALKVTPALRPWRGAGITHLLLNEDTARALREAVATRPPRADSTARRPATAVSTTPSEHPAPGVPFGPGSGIRQSVTEQAVHGHACDPVHDHTHGQTHDPIQRPSASLAVPTPASSPPSGSPPGFYPAAVDTQSSVDPIHSGAAGNEPGEANAPIETQIWTQTWTQIWQDVWKQMSAGSPHPSAVWTYAELGMDLRGQASPTRRKVLQELLGALRMPKGSHVFWPYSLPPDHAPDPDMFLAGLRRFRPASVLLIGDQSASDLAGIGALPEASLNNTVCQGYRFIRLPGMDELSTLSGPRREQLIAFIRATLD